MIYRSSSLDHRKAKSLDRELTQSRAAAERAAAELVAQDFACAADAEAAASAFRAPAPRWWPCPATVTAVTVTGSHARPGWPRRDAAPPTRTVYRVQITWGPRDEAAVQTELERRSTFVLITTLPADRYDARALLAEYKGQTSVEQRFRFLKDPAFVDAVFLKKPERIEALGYVMLMALLLFSAIERRVRQHPDPLPTPSRGRLARPTGYEVLRHLRGIQVLWRDAESRYLAVPAIYRPAFTMILAALGFTESIDTQVPARAAPSYKFRIRPGLTCERPASRLQPAETHGS